MKSAWKVCAILFLATALVGQTSTAAKPKKAKAAAATLTAADVQSLKDAIAAQQAALAQQQQQLQELRDELHRKDQSLQQAQTAATDAASKADAAQAQAAQQQQTVTDLKSSVTDLQSGMTNTVVALQDAQKTISEPPTVLHVKGITITPGGFIAAETVRRSRALASDVNTPFNNVTMPGASQNTMSEFFGSGRQSRISLLAEGRLKSVKLAGFIESDFLSAGITSNNNQSNSYTMRQRQAWGQAAFDNGWTFTGGQMWSLVTETKKGVENRSEALPMTIDAQYTVGFSWARQFGLRVAKNLGPKTWLAFSMENSQETLTAHGNSANFVVGSAGAGGGLYNSGITTCTTSTVNGNPVTTCSNAANYSFNPTPDFIAKLAFEPGFGHYEIFGVFSRFRDRVFPCGEASATVPCVANGATAPSAAGAYNSSRNGGGFGANARWSFDHKHLDFGLHGFGGSGIGRYGSGGLADASAYANGTLHLVKSLQGLTTLEWHGPKIDIYLNAGAEYASRAADFDAITGKYVGYGAPQFSNSGCYSETVPSGAGGFLPGGLSSCTADTRALIEGTAGFWFKLYDGSREKVNRGRIQFGPQFSYVDREVWSGASGYEPHGLDSMIFTSFRYYLP
ncbi:MAG TPA: hypothetical protein VFE61_15405 [Candidatus Sulfotelmatobacter sp.]|jgi:hypothetical protein|nr:hypothetical protein [Candidatus Sulfotelmatobacter sp.]